VEIVLALIEIRPTFQENFQVINWLLVWHPKWKVYVNSFAQIFLVLPVGIPLEV
jgi:hypothetical protein